MKRLPAAAAEEAYQERLRRRNGKRIDVPTSQVNSLFRREQKRQVRIEYSGPTKIDCLGCGAPFLFIADGKGRYPEYHSNACKQKAYRKRKSVSDNRQSRLKISRIW
jgi:hypothetical protein